MKTIILLVAIGLLLGGVHPAVAERDADVPELRALQDDLTNLDEELEAAEQWSPSRARDLQQRADQIREETTYLKVKMRRHQDRGGVGTGVPISEVEALRRDIQDLRAEIGGQTRSGDLSVPAGTELEVRLEESLSSANAEV